MCNPTPLKPKREPREVPREQREEPRGHRGSRPRGNPEIERPDFERAQEKLERVLGR
jgi:hypothetical protein